MDEVSKQKAIDSFVRLTACNQNQAEFYLDSADWSLELAIQQFYDNTEDFDDDPVVDSSSANISNQFLENSTEEQDEVQFISNPNSRNMFNPAGSSGNDEQDDKKPRATNRTGSSNIATLSSIRDDSDRDAGGQAFYAGGSEHSGQQVLGPQGSKDRDSDRLVAEMFRQAREHAVSPHHSAKSSNTNKSKFSGVGSTLGTTGEDSKFVYSASSSTRNRNLDDSQNDDDVETALKLWRDGFSIDDGPLRSYQDPNNSEFLASIRSGQIPRELSRGGRKEVHLKMEDHRTEEYQPPPKKPAKPFTGEGQRLGCPQGELLSQSFLAQQDDAMKQKNLTDANDVLGLKENEPNTRVQIRLADGSRLVAQINLDQPVSTLREYICTARPEYAAVPFDLMTTFPNKIIDNESSTIKESSLANAAIVQRLKNV